MTVERIPDPKAHPDAELRVKRVATEEAAVRARRKPRTENPR